MAGSIPATAANMQGLMVSDLVANEVSGGSDSHALLQTRENDGRFPKGVSGNPAGRPPGRKSEIVAIKQDLELAIRQHVDPKKVKRIIDKLVNKAMNGNLQAAKLILDKVLPNAGETEDEPGNKGGIRIVIENATFAAEAAKSRVINSTATEV